MTNSNLPFHHDRRPHEAGPPRDAADTALDRIHSDTFALWRLCDAAACRRKGYCAGEPARCRDACVPLIPPDAFDSGCLVAEAKCEGLSFDDAVARFGAGPFVTLHDWTTRLEACNGRQGRRRRKR